MIHPVRQLEWTTEWMNWNEAVFWEISLTWTLKWTLRTPQMYSLSRQIVLCITCTSLLLLLLWISNCYSLPWSRCVMVILPLATHSKAHVHLTRLMLQLLPLIQSHLFSVHLFFVNFFLFHLSLVIISHSLFAFLAFFSSLSLLSFARCTQPLLVFFANHSSLSPCL